MAQLRSRLNWLKEGDANTSYFQHHARYRKRKNFMAKINVDGWVIMEQEEKKETIESSQKRKFGAPSNLYRRIRLWVQTVIWGISIRWRGK
ncbi:hypothetical protein E2562_003041 [Oryza meyeriana var. granulata]|uniref:Uncharacterized protein n=1 Tax=Oryza meyeriana var. granulata TaxID=110450 RepID=A0A6G1DDY7_9ORYZ|nr:hypothetical protein E2562_003041 [Oryza meyeriana var. granulata]